MKRKLVNEDLIKINKLLHQIHINDKRVTFDFSELTVETSGAEQGDGNSEDLPPEELDSQSEEEAIAAILAKSEVPEQTGLRYLNQFWEYFETERGQILYSTYNVKLLQAIDRLFSQGMAPEEVKTVMDEGSGLFSPISETSREMAREYFDTMEPLTDFEEDEEKASWLAKAGKVGLAALAVLVLVAIGSYQLGFLKPFGIYPGSADSGVVPEETLEERPGEEQEQNGVDEEPSEEEIEEPADPVLRPEEITVTILNGSGAPGVAGRFAEKMEQAGYVVVEVDNADSFGYSRSQVISNLEEALEVLDIIPQAELHPREPDDEGESMITVILGADYVD